VNPSSPSAAVSERLARKASRHFSERVIEAVLFAAAAVSIFVTLAIVFILVRESLSFFQHVSLSDFLTDTQWTPLFDDAHFGIMVLLSGTAVSSTVALAVAIPLGTTIAIFLSEFASQRTREVAKPVLELLAGMPTVVFGYFALLFVTPLLQRLMPELPGFNLLSAGLVMGIMIVPIVSSISEDAMRAVPMASPRSFHASTWAQNESSPSHSSSTGTRCSCRPPATSGCSTPKAPGSVRRSG
jgi:phosphate transport system permease protein